jgi:hypothetical protein
MNENAFGFAQALSGLPLPCGLKCRSEKERTIDTENGSPLQARKHLLCKEFLSSNCPQGG